MKHLLIISGILVLIFGAAGTLAEEGSKIEFFQEDEGSSVHEDGDELNHEEKTAEDSASSSEAHRFMGNVVGNQEIKENKYGLQQSCSPVGITIEGSSNNLSKCHVFIGSKTAKLDKLLEDIKSSDHHGIKFAAVYNLKHVHNNWQKYERPLIEALVEIFHSTDKRDVPIAFEAMDVFLNHIFFAGSSTQGYYKEFAVAQRAKDYLGTGFPPPTPSGVYYPSRSNSKYMELFSMVKQISKYEESGVVSSGFPLHGGGLPQGLMRQAPGGGLPQGLMRQAPGGGLPQGLMQQPAPRIKNPVYPPPAYKSHPWPWHPSSPVPRVPQPRSGD